MTQPQELFAGRWTRIAIRNRDSITELRLHRDGGPLVWDFAVHHELTEALGAIEEHTSTKVLILTGTGDSFCNSIDVQSFQEAVTDWEQIWQEGREMLRRLVDLSMPVISVINGPARIHAEIGVLADVVLGADDLILADHAHFTRGTPPGDGVHVIWPALLGPTYGRYFLMTGAELGARQALDRGVIHELHPREDLSGRAWALAEGMAKLPRSTLRYSRAALSLSLRRHFAQDLSHGLALQGLAYYARGAKIKHDGER